MCREKFGPAKKRAAISGRLSEPMLRASAATAFHLVFGHRAQECRPERRCAPGNNHGHLLQRNAQPALMQRYSRRLRPPDGSGAGTATAAGGSRPHPRSCSLGFRLLCIQELVKVALRRQPLRQLPISLQLQDDIHQLHLPRALGHLGRPGLAPPAPGAPCGKRRAQVGASCRHSWQDISVAFRTANAARHGAHMPAPMVGCCQSSGCKLGCKALPGDGCDISVRRAAAVHAGRVAAKPSAGRKYNTCVYCTNTHSNAQADAGQLHPLPHSVTACQDLVVLCVSPLLEGRNVSALPQWTDRQNRGGVRLCGQLTAGGGMQFSWFDMQPQP
jgi:hypothetical protein